MSATIRVGWVYGLRKDDLNKYLAEFGLEVEGTVEEQRRRLAMFLVEKHEPERISRLLELQARHERAATPNKEVGTQVDPPDVKTPVGSLLFVPGADGDLERLEFPSGTPRSSTQEGGTPGVRLEVPKMPSKDTVDLRGIADQVRKWGLIFRGDRQPWEFVESLEERADMYGIPVDSMVKVMPEVLSGRALVWFRNNRRPWVDWQHFKQDFLRFFLPPRFLENLEDEIRRRRQKPREGFKDYMLAMQELLRHSDYSEAQGLDRIFRNALPEYQWYIRRKDFSSLAELLEMAEDLEGLPTIQSGVKEHHRRIDPCEEVSHTAAPFDPRSACRRCGQMGHFAARCRNGQVLFCWDCGRRDVRTIQCCRKQTGNESRTRTNLVGAGSETEQPLH